MESRWFNLVVVLTWLFTTTWLVVAKVVPPLRRGEPPNYRSMYAVEAAKKPVAWEMTLNGKSLGWAVNRLVRPVNDMTEVHSQIHFERIPVAELSPAWMRALVRTTIEPMENLQMDAFSTLEIDNLGHLTRFRSRLRVAGLRDAITITGKVQGSLLRIEVDKSEFPPTYLPPDALVTDELSPQSRLSDLRLGQEWTVPVFSPLRPPNNPVDILQARVERRDLLMWEGEAIQAFLVVYRNDEGAAMSSTLEPRAKLWVRDDGEVLKQEVSVLGSRLLFTRMSDDRTDDLAKRSEEEEERVWRRRGPIRDPQMTPPTGNFNRPNAPEDRSNNDSGIRLLEPSPGRK